MYVLFTEWMISYFLGSKLSWRNILWRSARWTLWKLYMLSWRTKEEYRSCRKYRGRIVYYNFFWLRMRIPWRWVSQLMIFAYYFDWMKYELLWGCCRVYGWRRRVYLREIAWLDNNDILLYKAFIKIEEGGLIKNISRFGVKLAWVYFIVKI
jgi:hypothetical protein